MRVLAAEHDAVGFDRQGPNGVHLDRDLFSLAGCDAVIHCAAHADVRHNWEDNALRYLQRDNIDATMCVLEAARKAPTVRAFVFVSTGAVYAGARGYVTGHEPLPPCTSPYAASKLAGEAYVQAYALKCGWRWCAARPAACFGTGYHHGHVRDFVDMQRRRGIHALDDGSVPRPGVHVEDVAEALVRMAVHDVASDSYDLAGGLWGWPDTLELMGVQNVSWEDRKQGWIGDGSGAVWGGAQMINIIGKPARPIADGVRDALTSLGWQ
jgi:nucleoside-diphosphate-sugar epimerase